MARESFTSGIIDVLLEAKSVSGSKEFRHPNSSIFMATGFCIKAKTGRPLTKEEILEIGTLILTQQTLVRRLYVLGWDTLIVEDGSTSGLRAKWPIKDFANMNNRLIGY